MPDLKSLRDAANAWAAQEQADIDSGAKKIPPRLSERTSMPADVNFKDLGEKARNTSSLQWEDRYIPTKESASTARQAVKESMPAHDHPVETDLHTPQQTSTNELYSSQERRGSGPGMDLGESTPGASKEQGLRGRAIAKSLRENRSSIPKSARERFKDTGGLEAPDAPPMTKAPKNPPKLTGEPGGEMTGSVKMGKAPKDLGRTATRLIKSAGEPGSVVSEEGGATLRKAAMKKFASVGSLEAEEGFLSRAAKLGKGGKALGMIGLAAGIGASAKTVYDAVVHNKVPRTD